MTSFASTLYTEFPPSAPSAMHDVNIALCERKHGEGTMLFTFPNQPASPFPLSLVITHAAATPETVLYIARLNRGGA